MSSGSGVEIPDIIIEDDSLTETEFFELDVSQLTTNNEKLLDKLDVNYKKAQEKIEKHFNYINNYLLQRKIHLLNKLNKIYENKSLNLKTSTKNENEFIAFSNEFDESLSLSFESDKNLSGLKQIVKLITHYGQIISTNAIETNCTLTGEGLMQCFMNEEASFTLSCRDLNNNLTKTHSSFINSYITTSSSSDISTQTSTNVIEKCKLEYLANGLFLVRYKIEKEGNYLLHILLNNKNILNSPYKITCLNNRYIKLLKQNNLPMSCLSLTASAVGQSTTTTTTTNQRKGPIKSTSFSQGADNIGGGLTRATSSYTASSPVSTPRSTASAVTATTRRTSLLPVKTTQSPSCLDCSFSSQQSVNGDMKQFDGDLKDDFKLSIGIKGRGQAEFLNPQSLCIANELIYATDSNNQRVHVFTLDGQFRFSFGEAQPSSHATTATTIHYKSNDPNSFILRRPVGIAAIESENKILVVDYECKCVHIFDLNGKYQSKIGHTKLLGPKGICVNKVFNNEIVVADCKANAICIFNLNGKLIRRFGSQGSKNENFAAPHYVSCLSTNGHLVISDFYNHSIKIFSANGTYQYSFGTHGTNKSQFNGPTGVCVDSYDNILVADWGNSRIQVFDKNGKFLKFVNTELNQLYGPQDLKVIENTSLIAIADSGNHCLKVFNYL